MHRPIAKCLLPMPSFPINTADFGVLDMAALRKRNEESGIAAIGERQQILLLFLTAKLAAWRTVEVGP